MGVRSWGKTDEGEGIGKEDVWGRSGRKAAKWRLTRRLYERGHERRDILELLRLIDWLVALPDSLARQFRQELAEYEKAQAMPYVTSFEKLGREEGREEGRQEGRLLALREGIQQILDARFKDVPYPLRERLTSLTDEAALKRLLQEAALAPSLEAFTKVAEAP